MSRFDRLFVWAGGAMFVASLAICARLYLFVLGRSMPWIGWQPVAFDAVLFSVFALHHSLFAREGVKRLLAPIPRRLLRSVYVWIASLLLTLVCLLWQAVGGDLYTVTGARSVAHAAAQLAGVWLIAGAVARIDPLELAGIHPPSGSGSLQITGPYRLVRHPLYLGWILATFGAAHMTGDRLVFATISALYLFVAVLWEERSLLQSFGEDYARYKEQVPWRILPYVY